LDAWKAREYGLIDGVLGVAVAPDPEKDAATEEALQETTPPGELTIHGRSLP
jgi:hypothetical protein